MTEAYIYFIKPVGMYGPIKIGCSTVPQERLETFTTWSPFPLEILATAPGGYKLEANLHDCFANAHLHSEWFEPVTTLILGIEALRSGVPIDRAFDLSKRIGSVRQKRHKAKFSMPPEMRQWMSYLHRVRYAIKRTGYDLHPARANPYIILHAFGWNDRGPPTEQTIALLEQFIVDPVAHWPKPQAAAA